MALSGTINGSTSNKYISGKVEWSATQSITDNKSTVTATLYYKKSSSADEKTYGTYKGYIYINGTSTYIKKKITLNTNNSWVYLGSATTEVSHDADGTKSIAIKVTGGIPDTTFTSTSLSSTVALNTIPRQATLSSAPNFTDEDSPKITYSNPAGSAASSLQACIASTDGNTTYCSYRDISKTDTSYTFSFTSAEKTTLQKINTSSNTVNVKFYVKTIIGSNTFYSSLQKTLTIKNPSPTLSPTVKDTNSTTVALTGDSSKLVKYYSTVSTTSGAAAVKNATLKSQKTTNGSKSVTTASGTFSSVESNSFVFSATDSRGNTTTKTLTPTMVNYVKLTCNFSNTNPTASGDMTFKVSGNYFNGSFGSVSNTLTVQYRYKVYGGSYSSWTSLTATKSGNTYTASGSLSGLDYKTTYVFQARAVDKLATKTTSEKSIQSQPIFDWSNEDFAINVPVSMFILQSPNCTNYQITVNDSGGLVATKIT